MKNLINYFYNISIDNLRLVDDNYYFIYNGNHFILYEIKDFSFDYQPVFELNKILINNNKTYFRIVENINNQIITYNSNKKYILMIDNIQTDKVLDFFDILESNLSVNDNNKVINKLNRTNWVGLWKNKIDYFEIYINHIINKYLYLNKYINYFIGLGECAITYAYNTISDVKPSIYDRLVVSHKRINSNNSFKQLYNPLNLVIDHQSRDIAEYMKMIFFSGEYRNIDIKNYLEQVNLSNYGARLIIARMLFPSFFFDMFEEFIEEKIKEEDIMRKIDLMNDYEEYLLSIYNILKVNYDIQEISWLKKVDYSSTLTTPNTSGTSFINIDSMPSLSVMSIMLQ